MSSAGATYCTFTALLQIQKLDSPGKAYSIALTAEFATSPAGELIAEIDSPERIAIPVEYYNDGQEQEFRTNAYFFCIGTLTIDTADATNPVLSVKAIQVLVCPGEPGSPTYEASVPLLGPAVLTFDGTVSMFEKHGDDQYFSAQVWHYAGKNNDGKSPRYSMGTIWCRIPPTPRWRNFNLPRAGHLVQLQGTVLGYFNSCICVDVNNLSYLKPVPPSESPSTTPSSSPPRKRRLGAVSGPSSSDLSSSKPVQEPESHTTKRVGGNRAIKRA
ncbi:hypothetical protein V8E54_000034 [Elaphomyces granulatus]